MSNIDIHYEGRSLQLFGTGHQGPAGLTWDNEGWQAGKTFLPHTGIEHDGSSYRSLIEHLASAETEPGIGADWRNAWKVVADRGQLTPEFAAFRAAIEQAARDTAEDAAATNGDREAIEQAVDAFGVTAAQAAQTISEAALQTGRDQQATAEDLRLTGLDRTATGADARKTGEDRLTVAADAAMAAAAVRPLYGVQIYRSVQVENGEYAAERYEPFGSTVSTVFIEMLNGTGSADVHMTVNGAIVAGPWTVTAAAPLLVQNLLIAVPKGAKASFHTSAMSGVVHEIWASAYGKYKA